MSEYEDLVELGFEGVDKFATKYHDQVAHFVGHKAKAHAPKALGGKEKQKQKHSQKGSPSPKERARELSPGERGGENYPASSAPDIPRYHPDDPLPPPEEHLNGIPQLPVPIPAPQQFQASVPLPLPQPPRVQFAANHLPPTAIGSPLPSQQYMPYMAMPPPPPGSPPGNRARSDPDGYFTDSDSDSFRNGRAKRRDRNGRDSKRDMNGREDRRDRNMEARNDGGGKRADIRRDERGWDSDSDDEYEKLEKGYSGYERDGGRGQAAGDTGKNDSRDDKRYDGRNDGRDDGRDYGRDDGRVYGRDDHRDDGRDDRRDKGRDERRERGRDERREKGRDERRDDGRDEPREYRERGGQQQEQERDERAYSPGANRDGPSRRRDNGGERALVPQAPVPFPYNYNNDKALEGRRRPRPARQSSSWSPPRRRSAEGRQDSQARRPRSKSPDHARTVAMVVGALAGGLAGSRVKKGEGMPNTAATFIGAVVGGLGAREGGKVFNEYKERRAEKKQGKGERSQGRRDGEQSYY